MENVIDFAARQREAAYKRRKMTEPPAAVVLLTQSGKIAAWATGRGANDDDVLLGVGGSFFLVSVDPSSWCRWVLLLGVGG